MRTRALVLVLVVAALGVLINLMPRASGESGAKPPVTTRVAEVSPPLPARPVVARVKPEASSSAAPAAAPPGAAPVIEAAYLEKREVCRGEENTIIVDAREADDADDSLLVTVFDPSTSEFTNGTRIPFRRSESGREPISVEVRGANGSQFATIPPVIVKDCDEPVQVSIGAAISLDARDRVRFTASVTEAGGSSAFLPKTYVWDFGDGSKTTTQQASVEHSYEGRSQKTRQSAFLVSVTVSDTDGRQARGSYAQTFVNRGYAALKFRDQVVVQYGVERASSPDQSDRYWLYHGYDQPVTIERVVVREETTNGARADEFAPHNILGFSAIPPGRSLTALNLDDFRPNEPGVVRALEIVGRAADGKEARARVSLTAATGS